MYKKWKLNIETFVFSYKANKIKIKKYTFIKIKCKEMTFIIISLIKWLK